MTTESPDVRALLNAAAHALRRYQHGNGAPYLAESVLFGIDAYLAHPEAPRDTPPREQRNHWCWTHGSYGVGPCPSCAAPAAEAPRSPLERDLASLLNRHCAENASDTPDFALGRFLFESLNAFNTATQLRDEWHGAAVEPRANCVNVTMCRYCKRSPTVK